MIDKIIENLVSVQKLRTGPNDLAFTQQFLTEHEAIINRLAGIKGIDREQIEATIEQKVAIHVKERKQAEEETKKETDISLIDSLQIM